MRCPHPRPGPAAAPPATSPRLVEWTTSVEPVQRKFDAALAGLRANTLPVPDVDGPLLIEGGPYRGVWLESAPLEAEAMAVIDPSWSTATHRALFDRQRDDGQLPCFVRGTGTGWSQVQTVNPIAKTALGDVLRRGDGEGLREVYERCARWDTWLVRYREVGDTGCLGAFCEYDTGHDKSPRWSGLPKVCRDRDARWCPDDPRLPYLAPDLTASLHGGRLALAEMAERLGQSDEAAAWRDRAADTRRALMEHCFDPETLCFYDVDARGERVRIVGDVLLRVLAEGVVDAKLFGAIFDRWVMNPGAFWTALPLPSIAACDPAFDHALPGNSWGGASQPLTALRAPDWFEAYGKFAELHEMMRRWRDALVAAEGFPHQGNPFTGELFAAEGYTPSLCVMVDTTLRMQGIRPVGPEALSWGCTANGPDEAVTCTLDCGDGRATLQIDGNRSVLSWNDEPFVEVIGAVRVLTDTRGRPLHLVGVSRTPQPVTLQVAGRRETLDLVPNGGIDLQTFAATPAASRGVA